MAATGHSYGPSCLLRPESNTFTRRASEASLDPPPIKPHYFYCSALPIDDPLSPVPPPPTGTTVKQKLPPRPFSIPDNASLEGVWLSIHDAEKEKDSSTRLHNEGSHKERTKPTDSATRPSVNNLAKIFRESKEGLLKAGKTNKKKDAEERPSPSKTEESKSSATAELKGNENSAKEQHASETLKASKLHKDAVGDSNVLIPDSSSLDRPPTDNKTGGREKEAKKPAKATNTMDEDVEEDGTRVENLPEQTEETIPEGQISHSTRKGAQAAMSKGKVAAQEVFASPAQMTQPDLTLCDDPNHIPFDETMPVGTEEIGNDEFEGNVQKRRSRNPFRFSHKNNKERSKSPGEAEVSDKVEPEAEISSYRRLSASTQKAHDSKQKSHNSKQKSRDSKQKDKDIKFGSSPAQHDTTGTPFLRIPSASKRSRSRSRSPETQSELAQADGEGVVHREKQKPVFSSHSSQRSFLAQQSGDGQNEQVQSASADHASEGRWSFFKHNDGHSSSRKEQKKPQEVYVTVGVSRLHVVEMRSLKMGPIYWDPVHDISSVVRGTWFYKETMWPVESDVANQIEEGYEYIKPWTPTYVDELNSCQEVGPEAELKLVHRLWPAEEPLAEGPKSAANKVKTELLTTATDQLDDQGQEHKNAIIVAGSPPNRAAGVLDGFDDPVRLFSKCSMIYVNARDAQILRPNQLPSVARGRKPLAAIRKGRPIGIPVVRGFDFKAWEKLYPPPKKAGFDVLQKPREGGSRAPTGTLRQGTPCDACLSAEERPKPTDLILIIHGIGQKLSERVESFNFTHSINAFRRQVNMELEADSVKPWLREGFGGIMVLPINWRSKIQLEEGAPAANPNRKAATGSNRNEFSLKDITEESIPAVRNLISDVLLDIPYYMSHHKPKMIEAVIKEANRVYRLWCNNNPGFHETGRVHIVAHSLGSVMSLDILSKQPTKLPKQLNFKNSEVRSDIFEFDTKGLFLAGSPVGLFLYINRAPLLPRKGREKPGADGEGNRPGVTGEAGTFGCLAVDNLYNIMHYIDPIAYRLNATVDVDYAASLKVADVPSTTVTWGQYFGFKSKVVLPTDATKALTSLDNFQTRPSVQTMPSAVEMETHNFTREEIAEKRMYLLNDNGQIDFTLRSGGGPLDIAYLNMLGAHSSYWNLQDFVRFLVVEIGRKPGKEETVASIKAVKKSRSKK